ncbi:DNA-binding IscR family transcriptional regulator [Flavobacterium sp. CG_23.5]|uniref:HopJ type III effector protein n=1 Tax=Flavobacterium sp. CG_23.5 TaxID=2760708 RepID=UPI001AE96B4E|nr:HopJ type III effector protein [Flavobacterium sp. CG_23.5]MBP2283904.1 DNA-binding IscR family transcriptional regulator [Flavobacterium sp. CG_23.5]
MNITSFLEKLNKTPEAITFAETIAVIEANFDFTETAFENGLQHNAAGENSGSCKLFAFAEIQNLSEAATLACFGAYYYDDVLKNPNGTDHQNIRNFMKTGYDGIAFYGDALVLKV